MDISIIIVNWNSVGYVKICLRSIFQVSGAVAPEVIVIDNASFDGCCEMVAHEFPQVIFIQSQVNVGFATANNIAALRARGKKLLFLNPDTEVLGDALIQMFAVFRDKTDAGLVGSKILNTDGSLQTSCVYQFPTILNQALDSEVVRRLISRLGISYMKFLYSESKGIFPVQVVPGACFMIDRDIFIAVEGFTTDYFMYSEDIDLSYKVMRAGYINYYTKNASVVHHGGVSSCQRQENAFSNIQMRASIYKFLQKSHGCLYARGYRATMLFVALVRIVIISVLTIPNLVIGRFPFFRPSFVKWYSILRWSLALEKWAR